MEIAIVVGMICAFLLGAFVRKPFVLFKINKKAEQQYEKSQIDENKQKQWNNLLDYNPMKGSDAYED